MAMSDDERREVAARLRSVGLDDIRYSEAICEVMMCAGLTCTGGEDCHGSDEHPECVVRVFNRLADLIEPTCDRSALLALADEMEGHGIDLYDMIPTPGRIISYAERIREALGVVE